MSKLPYTVIIRCLPLGVEDLEHYSKTCAVCDEVSVKPSMRIPSPGKPKTPHYACENEACKVGHFEVRSLLTYRTDVAAASDEGALSQGKELFHHADCDPVVGIFGTVVDVRVLRTELADTAGEGGDPLRGPMFNKRSKGAAG